MRALSPRTQAGLATLICLLATMLAPAGAEAKLYFTAFLAEGGTGIERASFGGGSPETLQFEPAGFEDDLALDTSAGKMYWTDTNAGLIASANLDGTDMQIVLDDFAGEPLGIALDVANGKLYWTDREGVKRASLDGTDEELLSKEPARGFIALDLAAQRMYWTDWPSGDIKAAAMTPEPTVTDVLVKQPAPFGIALDPAGGRLYWLELTLERKKSERSEIRSANLDGSEAQTLLERPGAGFEGGLAIDPAAGKLYWSETAGHDIGVANLDGSEAQTLLSTGEDSPEGIAVESSNPRPTDTSPPVIEGSARVGEPLTCQPGTWTGTGAISLEYQWEIAGGGAIGGASGSTYVPSAEQAGSMLLCAVSATDAVEESTATSAAVSVEPYPGTPPTPASPLAKVAALVAGIEASRLRSSGTRVRVPVFSSLTCIAVLEATPYRSRATRRRGHSKRSAEPRTITVSQTLEPGRGTITLGKLARGTSYRLALSVASADGQSARDTAQLDVVRPPRRPARTPHPLRR